MQRRPTSTSVLCHRFPTASAGLAAGLLVAALLGSGCSTGEESPAQASAPEPSGVLCETTDDEGLATVANPEGDALCELELRDSLGTALPGIEVTYFACAPFPVVAFTNPASGGPVGLFQLIPDDGGQSLLRQDGEPSETLTGVFILSLLDPTRGRLYDPERDGFSPTRYPTLASIRRVISLEDLETILAMTPGVRQRGTSTKGQIEGTSWVSLAVRNFDTFCDPVSSPELCELVMWTGRLGLFAQNQHDNYRYLFYQSSSEEWFTVPLGVQVAITIDDPAGGVHFSNPDDRIQVLSGQLDCGPEVVSTDGGALQLWANGVELADALGVGAGGGGAVFSSAPLELAEGENQLEIVAIVSEVNRGLENGVDGEAGRAAITVYYEPAASGPHAPTLTALAYDAYQPCPSGSIQITFHFADPDGDAVTACEHAVLYQAGGTVTHDGCAPVATTPQLACLRGTEADCSLSLTYWGTDGGDTIHWEVWVTDAAGLESQRLQVDVTITGDCQPLRLQGAGAVQGALGN